MNEKFELNLSGQKILDFYANIRDYYSRLIYYRPIVKQLSMYKKINN